MSNKTNKEQTAEAILRKYTVGSSWQNGSRTEYQIISAMQEYAALQLSAHSKEKEEEIRMLKIENDRLYLKLDDYERII